MGPPAPPCPSQPGLPEQVGRPRAESEHKPRGAGLNAPAQHDLIRYPAPAGDGSEGPAKGCNEWVKESHWRGIRKEPGSESRLEVGTGGTLLQQGVSKSPRALQGPTRCTHRLAGASGHTEQQGTNRTAGQQDSILPSPLPQLFAPAALAEKHLPRLLCEPKGRKPALPGQTGDDIVASLSCKFLNTTSCQGPLPTAPGLHADDLEPGWECQAWATPPAQPQPAGPARRPAWLNQENRCLAFQLDGSSLPPGNTSEGSSPTVLSHSCPGLGTS